jgi:single-strand DNA-binding protein
MSYQQITIVGNLGQDPELRYTQSGTAICELSVATNEKWTTKAGEKREDTTWFRIKVWGAQAENCERYLSKWRQVLVTGQIETDEYTDKQGVTRYTWEVKARNVQFLSGGDAPRTNGQRQSPPPQSAGQSAFQDDDIPF